MEIIKNSPYEGVPINVIFAGIAILFVGIGAKTIKKQINLRRKEIKEAALKAVTVLSEQDYAADCSDGEEWPDILDNICVMRNDSKEDEKARNNITDQFNYYMNDALRTEDGNEYYPHNKEDKVGLITASYIIALLSDMPARWLYDIASNRRY